MDEARENLIREIKNLKRELQERELSLPAHSIRPPQLLIIEELENRIHELEEKRTELHQPPGSTGLFHLPEIYPGILRKVLYLHSSPRVLPISDAVYWVADLGEEKTRQRNNEARQY